MLLAELHYFSFDVCREILAACPNAQCDWRSRVLNKRSTICIMMEDEQILEQFSLLARRLKEVLFHSHESKWLCAVPTNNLVAAFSMSSNLKDLELSNEETCATSIVYLCLAEPILKLERLVLRVSELDHKMLDRVRSSAPSLLELEVETSKKLDLDVFARLFQEFLLLKKVYVSVTAQDISAASALDFITKVVDVAKCREDLRSLNISMCDMATKWTSETREKFEENSSSVIQGMRFKRCSVFVQVSS